jgi:hypothetical protein
LKALLARKRQFETNSIKNHLERANIPWWHKKVKHKEPRGKTSREAIRVQGVHTFEIPKELLPAFAL